MTHTWWLMCSPRRRPGRSMEECDQDNSLYNKPNVNEEYLEAFRTKSYIEICNKAQVQLGRTISTATTTRSLLPSSNNSPTTPNSSSNSLPFCKHLTEQLLEPRQETITQMKENMKVHHLLVDYFEASLEACHCCDTILEGVHSIRLSYRRITRIFNLSKRVFDCDCECEDHKNCNYEQQAQRGMIYRELASFALLQNKPLSLISNVEFRDIHDKYMELLQRLRSKRGKIRRRLTFKSICKKVIAIALVASHSAILIALLVFSFHSIVGLVAAPSIVGGLIGLFTKRRRIKGSSGHKISYCERLCEQLDVAAKGVYILINDLDTMSRMVKRLHDEVEHRKVIADVCVRNYGKCDEILREVVREFGDNESSFLDQLDELEEHIYLCFLTINRSRSLLVKEIAERNKSI